MTEKQRTEKTIPITCTTTNNISIDILSQYPEHTTLNYMMTYMNQSTKRFNKY